MRCPLCWWEDGVEELEVGPDEWDRYRCPECWCEFAILEEGLSQGG